MTTIAFKAGVVAADTLTTTRSEVVSGYMSKIKRRENGEVIGHIGSACQAFSLARWYEAGCHGDQPEGNIVVFKPDESGEIFSDGGRQPLPTADFHAFGSGSEIAMGAMAMGADARRAVEIACELDVWSGGDIDVMEMIVEEEEDDGLDDSVIDAFVVPEYADESTNTETWRKRRGLA